MIVANFGSAPWTSAGENLAYILPFSVGVCVIILHMFSFLLSYLMNVRLSLKMIGQSLILAFIFGGFIDLFLYLHQSIYIPGDTFIRGLYLFVGLNFIAIGVSIYFQAGSIYLPTDYLLKAFGKLMKNYTVGNILFTAVPLFISIGIILYRSEMSGIGIGTLFFMFGLGFLMDVYNRLIRIRNMEVSSSN
ncbi:hypothetical protein [Oceanobacillus alkalisoli]|uniref:hypothetical protein n=1 Tax=Oceanobacillus alkalisoli TaxID=2925113 RepID=UPI001EF0AAEE|nr:hypothetical protein [Oceanobacillus alkalisoli]MCF3943991.1 hypothetical protein [Oceanobacillus alkalisoli]MCG5103263.1 hypothetical protein [Oceanobacillus alkalisoli]